MTGIGAGTDSFYEYLLKSYVLFGDDQYLEMYETAAEAIRRNLLHDSKYFYKHVHLLDGSLLASWVDSLSAFMPGVQVKTRRQRCALILGSRIYIYLTLVYVADRFWRVTWKALSRTICTITTSGAGTRPFQSDLTFSHRQLTSPTTHFAQSL